LTSGGNYEYMIRSVVPQTTGSGRYLNESLGVKASSISGVGIDEVSTTESIYPNPFDEKLILQNFNWGTIQITNSMGQFIFEGTSDNLELNTSQWTKGIYFLKTGNHIHKLIKK